MLLDYVDFCLIHYHTIHSRHAGMPPPSLPHTHTHTHTVYSIVGCLYAKYIVYTCVYVYICMPVYVCEYICRPISKCA